MVVTVTERIHIPSSLTMTCLNGAINFWEGDVFRWRFKGRFPDFKNYFPFLRWIRSQPEMSALWWQGKDHRERGGMPFIGQLPQNSTPVWTGVLGITHLYKPHRYTQKFSQISGVTPPSWFSVGTLTPLQFCNCLGESARVRQIQQGMSSEPLTSVSPFLGQTKGQSPSLKEMFLLSLVPHRECFKSYIRLKLHWDEKLESHLLPNDSLNHPVVSCGVSFLLVQLFCHS